MYFQRYSSAILMIWFCLLQLWDVRRKGCIVTLKVRVWSNFVNLLYHHDSRVLLIKQAMQAGQEKICLKIIKHSEVWFSDFCMSCRSQSASCSLCWPSLGLHLFAYPLPLFFHCLVSVIGAWRSCFQGLLEGLQGIPAMGAVFSLGAGWPPVEASGHPRHPTAI